MAAMATAAQGGPLAAGGPPAAPAAPSNEIVDITDLLNKPQCFCLNQVEGTFANVFVGMDDLLLRSDADEQLLMQFTFNETVRLHSLSIVAPIDDSAPHTVKVFANRPDMGFDDGEDTEPTQTLSLSPADLSAETRTELKFVKFQRVTTVTIYVEDNNGADATTLSSIKFYGSPVAGTNMSEFKKVG